MGKQANPYPLRIAPEVMAKLKVTARSNNRSVNKEIEFIAQQYIVSFEKENGPIEVENP